LDKFLIGSYRDPFQPGHNILGSYQMPASKIEWLLAKWNNGDMLKH